MLILQPLTRANPALPCQGTTSSSAAESSASSASKQKSAKSAAQKKPVPATFSAKTTVETPSTSGGAIASGSGTSDAGQNEQVGRGGGDDWPTLLAKLISSPTTARVPSTRPALNRLNDLFAASSLPPDPAAPSADAIDAYGKALAFTDSALMKDSDYIVDEGVDKWEDERILWTSEMEPPTWEGVGGKKGIERHLALTLRAAELFRSKSSTGEGGGNGWDLLEGKVLPGMVEACLKVTEGVGKKKKQKKSVAEEAAPDDEEELGGSEAEQEGAQGGSSTSGSAKKKKRKTASSDDGPNKRAKTEELGNNKTLNLSDDELFALSSEEILKGLKTAPRASKPKLEVKLGLLGMEIPEKVTGVIGKQKGKMVNWGSAAGDAPQMAFARLVAVKGGKAAQQ
ncbi:hypothetical protein JCM11641_002231 [Rhodosporidiobolus odoratus]